LALLQLSIPRITLRILQILTAAARPLPKQDSRRIFTPEKGSQCALEGSSEEHGSGPPETPGGEPSRFRRNASLDLAIKRA